MLQFAHMPQSQAKKTLQALSLIQPLQSYICKWVKNSSLKYRICEKPSYFFIKADRSDGVSLSVFPSLWQFSSPPSIFPSLIFLSCPLALAGCWFLSPSNKTLDVDIQREEGRRDLEKALGYWARTRERAVFFPAKLSY